MVKTGGINVAPVEVEEPPLPHAGRSPAFVTGVPDAMRDEVLAAVIVPKRGVVLTERRARRALPRLARGVQAAAPHRFATEEELPLTTTGKLQKNRLASTFFAA